MNDSFTLSIVVPVDYVDKTLSFKSSLSLVSSRSTLLPNPDYICHNLEFTSKKDAEFYCGLMKSRGAVTLRQYK